MRPPNAERHRPVQHDAVPERRHPDRVVPRALERQPERRPRHVAQQRVDDEGAAEGDVVEVVRVGDRASDQVRRRDAADAAEARDVGHLPEEEVRDHAVGERDHQEVDPEAAARERAEDEREEHRDREAHEDAPPRVPAEVQPLRVAVRGRVPDHEAGDPEERDLGERQHAAVGLQEDHARGDDPEQEHLRHQRPDPEAVQEQRRDQREQHDADAGAPFDRGGGRAASHAGRPKSPSGRTASTIATSANVKMIE